MTARVARRLLIVEDDFLLAMHLEDCLTKLGHEVVGHAGRIDKALELARELDVDFAILDINIAGTKSFPVADILTERDIPFVFATGYGVGGLSDGYRNEPVLTKPYSLEDLERSIARVFAGRAGDTMLPSSRS